MTPEDVQNFERTLELGKELAKDLSDNDLLGRWMAHHISDLIVRADVTDGPSADDLRREAADTILKLWRRRADAPTASQPTYMIDSVLATLTRLSGDEPWRFYGFFEPDQEPDDGDIRANTLLRAAVDLEDTVRDVVRHLVVVAADEAVNKEAPWLQRASHLAEDDQRQALRHLRTLQRDLKARYAAAEGDDVPSANPADENSHVVETLRRAEARIAEIRTRLEQHLPDTEETPELA